jgi:hypothetical protein
MIATQKILDTIRDFQIEMSHLNIDVEALRLSQGLTQDFWWERIEIINWIMLIK